MDALVGANLSAGRSETEGATGETLALLGVDVGDASGGILPVDAFDFMATRAVQESRRSRDTTPGSLAGRFQDAVGWAAARWWFWVVSGGLLAVLVIGLISIMGAPHDGPAEDGAPTPVSTDHAGGPEDPGGFDVPLPAVVEREAEPYAGQAIAEFGRSTLDVVHRNDLDLAYIELSMDGIPLWSQGMATAGGSMGQTDGGSGEFVRKTLFVPEGVHAIEVRITSESHGVDARGTIEGEFGAGMLRRLEVSLDSHTSVLALAWLD